MSKGKPALLSLHKTYTKPTLSLHNPTWKIQLRGILNLEFINFELRSPLWEVVNKYTDLWG